MRHAAIGLGAGLVPLLYFLLTLPPRCGDGLCTESALIGGVALGLPFGVITGLGSWWVAWLVARSRRKDGDPLR
ncbi:MAG: hypothetical protein U0353_13625 [Sandaracinus sp.]